jgi:3-phosphoshikimate 1-carboxyvinyltransferase
MKTLKPHRKIQGSFSLPGDKSISHRAALLSLLCGEELRIHNYSDGDDCASSLKAVSALGCKVEEQSDSTLLISPPESFPSESLQIDCGNSGTTARLLVGILSGLDVAAEISGDESLSKRPMRRIVEPLRELGAQFGDEGETLPLSPIGGAHGDIEYRMPVASAQVKSAILFAACAGGGQATVIEDVRTRDHSERLLKHFGATIETHHPRVELKEDARDPRKKTRTVIDDWKLRIVVKGNGKLSGGDVDIPGDISTAAFFFAAAAIGKGEVTIKNLGLNPTRTAFLDHLKAIGCEVHIENRVTVSEEPRGSVTVLGGKLKGRKVSGALAAQLIDEIPIVAVMACFAEGATLIRDVAELRVKECDRLEALIENLRLMGAKVGSVEEDGLVIEAKGEMQPTDFVSYDDHRIAMALSIASLFLAGESTIDNAACVAVSCPRFYEILDSIKL